MPIIHTHFLGMLIVLAIAWSAVMASLQSSKRSPPSADVTCEQNCLGGGNARMSRCLRFECRKRVFRYFMRIGKRRNEGGAMGGTEPDEAMDILQPGFPGVNEGDDDLQLQQKQQQNPRHHQMDDEDAALMQVMGLTKAERQRLEHRMLSRLLGRKAHFLLQKTPFLGGIKGAILENICSSGSAAESYYHPSFAKLCKPGGLSNTAVSEIDPAYDDSFEELYAN